MLRFSSQRYLPFSAVKSTKTLSRPVLLAHLHNPSRKHFSSQSLQFRSRQHNTPFILKNKSHTPVPTSVKLPHALSCHTSIFIKVLPLSSICISFRCLFPVVPACFLLLSRIVPSCSDSFCSSRLSRFFPFFFKFHLCSFLLCTPCFRIAAPRSTSSFSHRIVCPDNSLHVLHNFSVTPKCSLHLHPSPTTFRCASDCPEYKFQMRRSSPLADPTCCPRNHSLTVIASIDKLRHLPGKKSTGAPIDTLGFHQGLQLDEKN